MLAGPNFQLIGADERLLRRTRQGILGQVEERSVLVITGPGAGSRGSRSGDHFTPIGKADNDIVEEHPQEIVVLGDPLVVRSDAELIALQTLR